MHSGKKMSKKKKFLEMLKKKKKDRGMPKKRGKDAATQTSKADIRRDKLRGYSFDPYRKGDKVRSIHALPRPQYGDDLGYIQEHLNKMRSKMN